VKNHWQSIPLGSILHRIKSEVQIDDVQKYKRLTIRMNGKGVEIRDEVLGAEIGTKNQFRVREGQFVLSKIDARNGAFGLIPTRCTGAVITGNFWVFDVNESILDGHFFNLLTKTREFIDFCIRGSEGTTNRLYLQEGKFLEQHIDLPPLEEQKRIVARVETLAAKVEEARGLQQAVQEMTEALCRSFLFNQDGQNVFKPLRELVKLRPPDVSVQSDVTYEFAGVYSFGRGVFKGPVKSGADFAYPKLTRVRTGDFVYPKLMAWEGALGVVPPECDGFVVSTEFPVFEIDHNQVLPEVIDTYFRSPTVWPALAGSSTGTNLRRRRLNPGDFLAHMMPVPPMPVQLQLRKARVALTEISATRKSTQLELEALLPSILSRAFAGEL
jgi:type I restriction enzyme, S subunit